jgi:uncharacterized protein YbjT (DUF2867 family)
LDSAHDLSFQQNILKNTSLFISLEGGISSMNILIFGASGAAGGSVLRACFSSPAVKEVRVITRRPLRFSSKKLRVFLHNDYLNYEQVEGAFLDVNACLFCLGVSATQVPKEEYQKITHDFALAAANTLRMQSPAAVFHYISGKGTDIHSRFMWARVKAQTEDELTKLGNTVCWRPAFIDGELSSSSPRIYKILRPALRLLKPWRSLYVTGLDLGRAMLKATAQNFRGRIIENSEIRDLANS